MTRKYERRKEKIMRRKIIRKSPSSRKRINMKKKRGKENIGEKE